MNWSDIFSKIPIINFIPIFVKAWDRIPEEKQIEIATSIIMAIAKFAGQYGAK